MKGFLLQRCSPEEVEKSLWFLLWFSLPVSLKLTSYILLLLTIFTLLNLEKPALKEFGIRWVQWIPFVLFFTWQLRELFRPQPFSASWKEVEKILSLIVIPFLYSFTGMNRRKIWDTASLGLVFSVVICSCILLPSAFVRFLTSHQASEFFYHQLSSPLHTGAIFLSLYILFAIILLKNAEWIPGNQPLKWYLLLYLIVLLLLLSSKVLIITGLPFIFLLYRDSIFNFWKKQKIRMVGIIVIIMVGLIPVFKRFQALVISDRINHYKLNFNRLTDSDGYQIRLFLWKTGFEMSDEQRAWMTGNGMVKTKVMLNEKILDYVTKNGKTIQFQNTILNFHNQYVETLVRQGILGLMLYVLILAVPFFWRNNQPGWLYFNLIVILLCISESVLERQAGIVFLSLFLCSYLIPDDKNAGHTHQIS